jgi:hypothetical protein
MDDRRVARLLSSFYVSVSRGELKWFGAEPTASVSDSHRGIL